MRPPLTDINNEEGLIDLGSIPGAAPVASFNIDGIENLIQTKGFKCLHYQHALLPDMNGLNNPIDPNTQGASLRGVMYYSVRETRSVPQNFKLEDRLTVQGLYGVGSVLLNVAGNYTDQNKEHLHLSKRDLLIFPDVTDKVRQLVQIGSGKKIKLKYKVKGVDLLFDSKNYYQNDVDYRTVNGEIEWLSKNTPDVLSVVYWYTPIYIIRDLPHSLRIIPSNPQGNAAYPREATYAPQLVIAQPSTLMEENDIMDWKALPEYQGYKP